MLGGQSRSPLTTLGGRSLELLEEEVDAARVRYLSIDEAKRLINGRRR